MWPSVLILLYGCSPLVKVLWVEELIEACHRFIVRVSEANASVGVLAFDPELPECGASFKSYHRLVNQLDSERDLTAISRPIQQT
jgi:hypothetical protein